MKSEGKELSSSRLLLRMLPGSRMIYMYIYTKDESMSYNHSGIIYCYTENGSEVVDEWGKGYRSLNEAIREYKLKNGLDKIGDMWYNK